MPRKASSKPVRRDSISRKTAVHSAAVRPFSLGARPLGPDELWRRCDPKKLNFKSTAELEPLDRIVGQDRAVAAVRFGIGIKQDGYNMFALGPLGTGKHTVVRGLIETEAAKAPAPPDLCYVYNFSEPHRPKALVLPAGRGLQFYKDVENLLSLLKIAIPATLSSDEYRGRRREIENRFKDRQDKAIDTLQGEAREKNIDLRKTSQGFAFAPARNGEPLSSEEVEKLPKDERAKVDEDIAALQKKLEQTLRDLSKWDHEMREQITELRRDITNFSIGHMFAEMRTCYEDLSSVQAWIDEVRQDLLDNIEDFLAPESIFLREPAATAPGPTREPGKGDSPAPTVSASVTRPAAGARGMQGLRRYRVNLMVDNSETQGAPVVYEDNPNLQTLFGRIEHISRYGTLTTDFTLIHPGALHRANGGYLILEANHLLNAPHAWEELKLALKSRMLRIDTTTQVYSVVATVSLEPEAVPLDVKVVLLGERGLYYRLSEQELDFGQLFKVAVDFEESMDRRPEMMPHYVRLLADLARERNLRPFDVAAIARIVEHASRLAEDAEKVTMHVGTLGDILSEADYWAGQNGHAVVMAEDVQASIDARIYRTDRMREQYQERIMRETVLIDTSGEQVGQINGLTVLQLGDFSFGHPARITARVSMGWGDVVDIEREVDLGGPLHSKGVLILSSFLAARYLPDQPLSLHASLVFEQSYGGIDGDSASSAELYALMSSLAEVPIRQSFAVTGSVNQLGQVQAIGAVNEKIEGYFDVCQERGLTGEHSVLIPRSNVTHLMLRQDVREAVAAGKFHIIAIDNIDQGIELLTGLPAGTRGRDGKFPAGSVNGRIEARLSRFARMAEKIASGSPSSRR